MYKLFNIIKRLSHSHSKSNFKNIVSSKVIGNPSCSDCIYVVPSETYDPMHAKCRRFVKRNLITGLLDLSFADINRETEQLCGPNARYKE